MQACPKVLITGASSGIGRACVEACLAANLQPIAMVRSQTDLDEIRQTVDCLGENEVLGVIADVCDSDSLGRAAETLEGYLTPNETLFGLVNSAGIAPPGPLMFQPAEQWERVIEVNTLGTFRTMQAFGPLLGVQEQPVERPGRIVNITSIAGQVGWPYLSAYSASKHAVEGLSDAARRELVPYGIDVIVVGPGAVKTPIWAKATAYDLSVYDGTPYADNLDRFVAHIAKDGQRGLAPEHIGKVVVQALTARNPKPRYAPVPNPLTGWLLPRFLPRRWLDAIMARALGFK